MKNKEAFEKWVDEDFIKMKYFLSTDLEIILNATWQACEEFYESRKCEDCKHFYFATFPSGCNAFICSKRNSFEVTADFCCKYFEVK